MKYTSVRDTASEMLENITYKRQKIDYLQHIIKVYSIGTRIYPTNLSYYHTKRVNKLVDILNEHPNCHLETCMDELTGIRFGHAKKHINHCEKIGSISTRGGGTQKGKYQIWAVW